MRIGEKHQADLRTNRTLGRVRFGKKPEQPPRAAKFSSGEKPSSSAPSSSQDAKPPTHSEPFHDRSSAPTRDNADKLADSEKTDTPLIHRGSGFSPLTNTVRDKDSKKENLILGALLMSAGALVSLAFPAMIGHDILRHTDRDIKNLETHIAEDKAQKIHVSFHDKELSDLIASKDSTMNGILLFQAIGSIPLLIGGAFYGRSLRRFRQTLQRVKHMKKTALHIHTEEERASKRVNDLLKLRIERDTARIAKRFDQIYEQVPEAKEKYNQELGSKKNLPTPEDIRELFEYYAYQLVIHEKTQAGEKEIGSVQEGEYLTKLYTLLRIGLQGESIFDFVQWKRDMPFDQTFQKDAYRLFRKESDRVNKEVEILRALVNEELSLHDEAESLQKNLERATLMKAPQGTFDHIQRQLDAISLRRQEVLDQLTEKVPLPSLDYQGSKQLTETAKGVKSRGGSGSSRQSLTTMVDEALKPDTRSFHEETLQDDPLIENIRAVLKEEKQQKAQSKSQTPPANPAAMDEDQAILDQLLEQTGQTPGQDASPKAHGK